MAYAGVYLTYSIYIQVAATQRLSGFAYPIAVRRRLTHNAVVQIFLPEVLDSRRLYLPNSLLFFFDVLVLLLVRNMTLGFCSSFYFADGATDQAC